VVFTGSFNYTYYAEHRNVENLLVIRDPAITAQDVLHWRSRAVESRPLRVSASAPDAPISATRNSMEQNSVERNSVEVAGTTPPSSTNGPIVGNRRSRIYEWPGCPAYAKVSSANRVEFLSAQAAEQAGYRAAATADD
jgi:hypothetical protein